MAHKYYTLLKKAIARDFGINVERLLPKNIVCSRNRFDEVNIYGEAVREGGKVYIAGECNAQFGHNDVEKYLKLLERVEKHLDARIALLAFAISYHPDAEDKLQAQGIRYYSSYELSNEM